MHQLIDSIQAIFDFLLFSQGLFDPAAQQAATHGGCRAVEQPEQRSLLSSAAHGLGQLEIPPRNGIKQQMLAAIVDVNRVDMRQRLLLRFFQILQQCTGSGDSQIQFSQAQCCDGNAGMLFDQSHRFFSIKGVVQTHGSPLGPADARQFQCIFCRYQYFGRIDAHHFFHQLRLAGRKLHHRELSG